MAINYADKHAQQIDERFTAGSITEAVVNKDYDFVGVKTVKVHSVPTVALNDYKRTGSNRYGEPAELEDALQEMTMTQDKSFTFTVDKGNSADDPALNAGKALQREIDEVIIPTVDKYRLAVMAAHAKHRTYGSITKTTAYEAFLDVNALIDDDLVPTQGRVAVVSSAYYKLLKQDSNFVKNSDLGMRTLITGQLGEVDGVPIVKDLGRLPAGVSFMIAHPSATTAPHKLSEYKVHEDPPGLSGALVEGRDYYDAFVLNNKACAIGVRIGKLLTLTVTNEAGTSGKTKFTAASGYDPAQGTLVYQLGASVAAPELGADISDTETYPELTLGMEIAASSGDKYIVALKGPDGCCIGTSGAAAAAAVGA